MADSPATIRQVRTLQETVDLFMDIYKRDTRSFADVEHRLNEKIIDLNSRMEKVEMGQKRITEQVEGMQAELSEVVKSAVKKEIQPVQQKTENLFNSKSKIMHYKTNEKTLSVVKYSVLGIFLILCAVLIVFAMSYFTNGESNPLIHKDTTPSVTITPKKVTPSIRPSVTPTPTP